MIIHKILNNNAVVSQDDSGQNCIVTGRGLAFGKKAGDQIKFDDSTEVYVLADNLLSLRFEQVVAKIPIDYIEVAQQIIAYAKRQLPGQLSDIIYITLPDHIYGTVQRYRKGIILENKLLLDIKRIYSNEFRIGEMAVKKLNSEFNMDLTANEAAYIAQHFINAQVGGEISDVPHMTEIIEGILNIVKFQFGIIYDEDSISYERFLTHLKYLCYRMKKNEQSKSQQVLLPVLEEKYPKTKAAVDKIGAMLEKNYDYRIHDDERMYLMIHINRILEESL